ncbi:MAG TPA: hypothetical protein VGO29_00275 [Solirubrobacteraceae bacterium]|jgi:hypothetical protein|nr:hypothetical protein [Solirubrobacteraceae bacterium]
MSKLPEAAKPAVGASDRSIGWLVGAVSTVALLFGAVGIGTGDVPLVLRNHPVLAGTMFVLVILGSLLAAAVGWIIHNPRVEHWLLLVSAAFLAAAAIAALWTGIESAVERASPGITTSISDVRGVKALRFDIKDSGLKSSDKLTIKVQALTAILNPKTKKSEIVPAALYAATVGPNSAGNVDQAGTLAVPPAPANDLEVQAWVGKKESCYGRHLTGPGCATVHITRSFEKPQLTVAWRNHRHSGAGLFIHVSAHDVAEHRIVLRVVDAKTFRRLLIASWPPTASGTISKAVTAIVPASTRRVCVAASAVRARPNCSPPRGSGTASALTLTPPP